MMKLLPALPAAVLACAASLLLTGCPGPPRSEVAATSAKAPAPGSAGAKAKAPAGKQLYMQSCSACHGADAKGMPNLGKDMTGSEFIKGLTDDELLEFIKKGRAVDDPLNTTRVPMPPKGGNPGLKDDQLREIIGYIRTLMS